MEVQTNREKIANDSDVKKMISDVSNVLSKHLISIIGKCKGDTEEMEKYILSIPFVKKINDENIELKKELDRKNEKIVFLNNNLSTLSQKYTELFFRNNKVKITASISNDKNIEEKIEVDNSVDKNNIKLEVKDSVCNDSEIDSKIIEKDVEDSLEEKRRKMLGITSDSFDNMESMHLNDDTNRFSELNDEESKEEEAEEEEASEEASEEVEEEDEEEEDEEEEDEEEDEEEEAEEEAEEEDEEEEDEEEAEEEDEEDDEEEVVEVEIEGTKYFASETKKGDIYEYLEDGDEGDIGEVVGHYVNHEPIIF